ncbi:hypothetical protein [Mesonia sp. HuA40]|uniref:hypothetical protein n=1 Tax=Mesonia sp. HuA40 TaxID=2602761 RepID=UPI0011C72EC1|nr:hypothetical protein [Mesonia sp. HuA40]TXK73929.1 hypothetical protein FT993_03460 [Mesonia sp. HuA40]
MIIKFTVRKRFLNRETNQVEIKEKEYNKLSNHFFDYEILEHLDESDIEEFAIDNLGLEREENIFKKPDPKEIDTQDLINELKSRGFEIIKNHTLADSYKIAELKNQLQIN